MEHIPDDELISAYLDGELTGKDLARAEQLLASQPDSRQMLDELTALRASLQALPQQKLGQDFAEAVLRRAEREMLQPRVSSNSPAVADVALPTPVDTWKPEVPPILSMSRWTRPLVWAALTTAAAIMIMMFSPADEKQKVALAPKAAVGPAPADLAMQARDVAAPDNPAMIAADAAHGDPAPQVAGREPAQNHFFAGPDSAARGGRVNPTPELFRMEVHGGDDALLVVLCDVTPEVASSASFRRLLAEQQIPWQEVQAGGQSADGQAAFAAQESAGAGKEADAPAADKAQQAEPASVTKGEVAADASKPLPAESGATPSSTEAVYVVAAPSQVDATIAAIAGSAEYRNLQMKELTGPLPHELLAGMREHRGEAPKLDAAQENAAQPLTATADSARGRSPVSKRNLAKSGEGTDRADAPPTPMSSRMATTAAATPGAANAPGAADTVTSPLVMSQPPIAHAEPALLSSATIAELSRAVDLKAPATDEKASGEQGQPGEQAWKDQPFEKQSSNEKQAVAGSGVNRDAADGNAVDDESRGNKSDRQKYGAKDSSQQQKLPLGQSEAAPDGDGDGSLGGSQMRSGKAVRGNLKAGPKKLDAQDVKDRAAPKPDSDRDQNSLKTMAAPTDPRPAVAPVRPEGSEASPASPAPAAAASPPAPAMVPTPAPASAIAGAKLTDEGKNAGAGKEPLHDKLRKQESTKSLEAVPARRAIFLFRVVPVPAAEPQR